MEQLQLGKEEQLKVNIDFDWVGGVGASSPGVIQE